MQSKHLLKLLILATGLLLCACGRQKIYSRFEHVSDTGWEKVDTIDFYIPPIAESGTYHEALELRIDNTYPFQSLTMEVTQTVFPENKENIYNKVCQLIDKKGNIIGSGISLFSYTFPFNNIMLNRGDSLHITIVHCMKREIMPGVVDVGVTLTKQ